MFENEDGTRTAYILAEPVKYVDSMGQVREKNLTLSQGQTPNASVMATAVNTSAYTVTATNTPMIFPCDLSQGVQFTYGEYTITLRPETVGTDVAALQADGKVLYRKAFGSTAHLAYTPQLNGLKEDIVLTRYTGQNTFSFILNTDGLLPASDAGGYYLHDGTDLQIRLGQVVSYDADGDFSIGEMTVEPISGTNYRVTLTVDKEFLEDAFYPVTVDPTLELDGNNLFDDASIYNVTSNATLNTHMLKVGFVSTEAMRSIIRINGLTEDPKYLQYSWNDLVSAHLHLYSTEERSLTIQLYRNTVTGWDESSVTWEELDMEPLNNSTVSLSGIWYKAIDITTFVRYWMAGIWSVDEGIVIAAANEPTNGNKMYFASSEATTNAPYISITYVSQIAVQLDGTRYVKIGSSDYQLSAQPRPVDPSYDNLPRVWTSSNTAIATVDINGKVTGKSEGIVTITASITIEGKVFSGSCYLYVVPILPGSYLLRNTQAGMYADYGSDRVVKENEYNIDSNGEVTDQKWIFTYHVSEKKYLIRSSRDSSLYLTVTNGAIKVDSYSNATHWDIDKGEVGFKLIHNTATFGAQYVLACETDQAIPGASLIQRAYSTTDGNYLDEWYLGTLDASLIAIYEENKDRSGYFNEITESLESCGYTNVFNNHSSVTKSMYKEEFLEYLGQSKIVLIRTHGLQNSIQFKDANNALTSADFTDGLLDGVELIIYGACLTGQGGETAANLVTATVAAGARTVIGFNNEILFDHCNDFCEKFFELYAYYCNNYNEDIDFEDICNEAANYTQQTNSDYFDVGSVVIAGNKTLLIR